MYFRQILPKIQQALKQYKVITLLGPRQSGKTTLAKMVGLDFDYFNLEDLSFRERLREDPKSFFLHLKKNCIIDEVKLFPELLSYVQLFVDQENFKWILILIGSNSLLINEKVSQSLAGRTRIFYILPLSYSELPENERPQRINQALYQGLYPRIYWEKLDAKEWITDYIQTYVQKDVRQVIQIENMTTFDKFLRLLAGRVGQVLNYASLASETGISIPTVKHWISILEASFIVYTLSPHFKNFSKRITKTPKVYFYDTAILCFLLRIHTEEHLENHPLRGNIFENWVITEKVKQYYHAGELPALYFWRDQHGHEVDLLEDRSLSLYLMEIKSSTTFHASFLKNLIWLNQLQNQTSGEIIYGGDEEFVFQNYKIRSWRNLTV